MQIRRVINPLDKAIKSFASMQAQIYFDPDMLIPENAIRMMIAEPVVDRDNVLLVAEEDQFLGGVLFHYLKKTNTGFSSFMGTTLEARGKGVARKLHEARFEVLNDVAAKPVEGVFLDSVNPQRLTLEELEAEKRSGADPVIRWRIFQRFGFRRVHVRYEQPVGGPDGGPVTNMDLLYCSQKPAETVATDLVVETMQAYWTPWLGAVMAEKHAGLLRERAGIAQLKLLDLSG